MCLLLLSLKKTPLLEITFVHTGFVLFAILAAEGEMEYFLFLTLVRILPPEVSRSHSLPGQLLESHCLSLKGIQSWEKKKSYGIEKLRIRLIIDGIWSMKITDVLSLLIFHYEFLLVILTHLSIFILSWSSLIHVHYLCVCMCLHI